MLKPRPLINAYIKPLLLAITVVLLAVFGSLKTAAVAEPQISKVFSLNHRSAAEMIHVIKPLLGPQDSIGGLNNQLVIRADSTTLETIASLLSQLDIAPRNIVVNVRRGGADALDEQSSTATRRYQTNRDRGQQMQGQEGRPIYFVQSEDIPFIRQIGTEAIATDYQQIRNGIQVVVTIRDATATIDVMAENGQLSRHGAGGIEKSRLQTRIVGPVGDWLTVATFLDTANQAGRRVISVGGSKHRDFANLQIRVDLLPQ